VGDVGPETRNDVREPAPAHQDEVGRRVSQVAERVFSVGDPRAAAWFVLAGLQSVELAGIPMSEMPAALTKATALALRALGYQSDLR